MKLVYYVKQTGQYAGAACIPDDMDPETAFNPHRDSGYIEVPGPAESGAWFWNFETKAWHLPASADTERGWRDVELAAMVWLRDRHRDQLEIGYPTTLTAEQFTELLMFMQALRDWPQAEAFPDIRQRPKAPDFLSNMEVTNE